MTILAAIDGEHTPDRVVEVGHDLASTYDEQFVVLHVMPEGDYTDHQTSRRSYTIEQAEDDAASVAENVVMATLDGIKGTAIRGAVGEPAETILSATDGVDAHFLIVGGRKRSPVGKAIFGSTSQEVLLNADCPVVSVRPPTDTGTDGGQPVYDA